MSARTYLLAAGAFTVGTSGYILSGLLPAVSRELDVSLSTAGQLLTVFALSYAVAAPALAALTGRWDRRKLLVAALLVSALGNVLSALAPNYPLLLVARVVSALGAAAYTPAATLVATALTTPEHRGRAVATVFGGLTFSLIVGVPAGSLLGGSLGYQGVFAAVGVASLVAAGVVRLGVPQVAAPPVVSLRERFAAAADRRVVPVLAMTVLACLAAFSVFTYISPLLAATAGVHGTVISLLLFAYGVGGAIGNSLGGRLTDRFGSRRLLFVVFAVFTAVLVTLPLTATTTATAGVALFVWGLFTWSVNPPIQNWLIELAPTNSGLLLSLNASAIYLGVGISGLFGGLVIDTVGITLLPPIAGALALVAFGLLVHANRRSRAPEPVLLAA
ncbi:MFS transporter [Umezawaea tangerina]|uniref:Putative MFS family arabinose efflux permease n=1 Tax=Umezawaea tangerina TaxID=84725 RepID=A0A2T0TDF2_9PSEU|nr:MFS transporter [Umezawaea tangerina]PRY43703.1 putative MFS family arabinose efflux permease [Umezawaea tangerina]